VVRIPYQTALIKQLMLQDYTLSELQPLNGLWLMNVETHPSVQ
jgi:hypothetical protein